MNKPPAELRIVRYWHSFFSHWCYRLEKKKVFWFFGNRTIWQEVAGNGLTTAVPPEWRELNIIDEITIPIGE